MTSTQLLTKEKHFNRPKKNIFLNITVIIGLSTSQAASYLAVVIFKLQLFYYMLIVFAFTFLFSIYLENLSKALFYAIASTITGLIISLIVVIIPPLIFQDTFLIDLTVNLYLGLEVKLLLFNIVICLISSIIGGMISEK